MGLIPGPSTNPQPPPRLSISIRGMRVDSGGKTQMRKTTQTHLLILHSSDSNSKLLWYHNFVKYLVISSLYPWQLLQYITTKGWLACIGIGEKEFMSLSFPQIVKIQEPGQQHIDFLVAIQYFNKCFFSSSPKKFSPLISPPRTILVSSDEPCLVSRVAPLCYIITTHQPGK